jgi:hypothetical protein
MVPEMRFHWVRLDILNANGVRVRLLYGISDEMKGCQNKFSSPPTPSETRGRMLLSVLQTFTFSITDVLSAHYTLPFLTIVLNTHERTNKQTLIK